MQYEAKNSLLTDRVDGQEYQILSDERAVYALRLGPSGSLFTRMRAIDDLSGWRDDPGSRRFERDRIELVHIIRSEQRSEITLKYDPEEITWRMSVRIPDEAIGQIFGGLNVVVDEESEAIEPKLPPVRGSELMGRLILTTLAVFCAAMWWARPNAAGLLLSLLVTPACAAYLGWSARRRDGRLHPWMLLWTAPGLALSLLHARVNFLDLRQLIGPCLTVALALAALYLLAARSRARPVVAVVVALTCLITCAPGTCMALNGLSARVLAEEQAVPVVIREEMVEVRANGTLLNVAARPEVTRQLSRGLPCRLVTLKGLLGIEYRTIEPVVASSAA